MLFRKKRYELIIKKCMRVPSKYEVPYNESHIFSKKDDAEKFLVSIKKNDEIISAKLKRLK